MRSHKPPEIRESYYSDPILMGTEETKVVAGCLKEHKNMFDAAIKRDAEKAQAVLTKHITRGLKHTLKAFDSKI